MHALLLKQPIQVNNRLEKLGIRREQLMEVISAMVAGRNNCTENDPPAAPGWTAWRDGTRRLREIFCPLGWQRCDTDMISCIYHPELGIKIAVSNTDDATGLEGNGPQNRSQKGAATDRAVSMNQFVFSEVMTESLNKEQSFTREDERSAVFWYLCVFNDGDVVRAELSCPVQVSAGYFSEFRERILIESGEFSGDDVRVRKTPIAPEPISEFDIPVKRKQAS